MSLAPPSALSLKPPSLAPPPSPLSPLLSPSAVSPTHKALAITHDGGAFEVTERETKTPGPWQMLVRVLVGGLNQHDQKVRDEGLFYEGHFPISSISDITGIVISTGVHGKAKGFKPGDVVVGQGVVPWADLSGLQEYVLLHPKYTIRIPEGMDSNELVSLPTNLIACVVGLFDPSSLGIPAPWTEEAKTYPYHDTVLLIVGGGSNCGKYATQLASLAGIGTIIVTASERSKKELMGYGATHVVDRNGTDDEVVQRIRDVAGDEICYALDVVNENPGQILAAEALSNSKSGTLARLCPHKGEFDRTQVKSEKKEGYELRNVFGLSHKRPKTCDPFWERLPKYLVDGLIKPVGSSQNEPLDGLDPDKLNEKLDMYRDGKLTGQVPVRLEVDDIGISHLGVVTKELDNDFWNR